jgi:hypothetical protein
LIYLTAISFSKITRQMMQWLVKKLLKRMWEEAVVFKCKLLSCPGETGISQWNHSHDWNSEPPRYKVGRLTTVLRL